MEPTSDVDPCTTGIPLRRFNVGTFAWEDGPDDRLGLGHDLPRRPVVDRQRGQRDPVEPVPLEPVRP
jgi:hypothetical protein